MYSDLFFVPSSGSSRKSKKLIESACRAHNMKFIHRKRRSVKSSLKYVTSTSKEHVGAIERESEVAACNKSADDLSKPVAESFPFSRCRTTLSEPTYNLQDFTGTMFSLELSRAVWFVQFHLVKSWSPTFMQRLRGDLNDTFSLKRNLQPTATQSMWLLWTSNMHLFWSIVASVLPLLTRDLPMDQKTGMVEMALAFKERSYNVLRKSIADIHQKSGIGLLTAMYHVKSLFREACTSGDVDAARCHADALARLASRSNQSCTDIERGRIALWGDAVPALLQLRRPAVDLSAKMTTVVQDIWSDAEFTMGSVMPDDLGPIESILVEDLQDAFTCLKRVPRVVNHYRGTLAYPCNPPDELIFQWVTTKAEHHMCQLLDFYYHESDRNEILDRKHRLSKGESYIHMSAALALLHIYQKAFFDIYQADGTDLNESAMAVLPDLKRTLQFAEEYCSKSEWLFYRTTVFWILFIGAWAEQRLIGSVQYLEFTTMQRTWFSSKLLKLARRLDLTSWSKAKPVLQSFAWIDYLDERIGIWYENVVCELE